MCHTPSDAPENRSSGPRRWLGTGLIALGTAGIIAQGVPFTALLVVGIALLGWRLFDWVWGDPDAPFDDEDPAADPLAREPV